MKLSRRSGILLHPTSLPSPFGSGDFGKSAYYFVDWLKSARQTLWQTLPLVEISVGNSPYMSPSAFAGNVLLIDLEALVEQGLLSQKDIALDKPFHEYRVDYPLVSAFRLSRLRLAAENFFKNASPSDFVTFTRFCDKNEAWLEDYALFKTLNELYVGVQAQWANWPQQLAKRDSETLKKAKDTYRKEIDFWKFCQWIFANQCAKLKKYANDNGIELIGDIPIFLSFNSADVWAHPELFLLDQKNNPMAVAGVPPDKFSETGQRWGNPLYNWEEMRKDQYDWWCRRMVHILTRFDYVRLDHFRGFEAYWEIPAKDPDAMNGKWQKGPGPFFFSALRKKLGALNIIAEDLGVITDDVIQLRKAFDLPGMRILQFAFDKNPKNLYLPHNYEIDSVAYTGTHDNNTTVGWWQEISEEERDYVRRYLSIDGHWIHWDLIRAASASIASFAIFPMQDILGLDASARMNLPGTATGSWEWRFSWSQVESWHANYLAEITQLYGRA